MLFLLTAAISATLCAAQSAHSIDASAASGDVMVPTGAFTTLTVTAISGKQVTVPAGVTADSLDFSGGISNGVLEIQGGTFGAVTVGAMTGGSVAFSGGTVNGNVAFSTLTGITGLDIGGLTVVGGAVTFGAINGSAAKPNVSLADITVTSTAGTKGVYFSSTVYSLGGLSFKNANISITGTANVYALRFADVVEYVDELVLDGATVTSTCSGSTAGSVYGYSAMRIGRVSATGAVLTATASASAFALYLAASLSGTFVSVRSSTITATSTADATAYAAYFGTMSGASCGIEFRDSNVTAEAKTHGARALYSGGVSDGRVLVSRTRVIASAETSSGAYAGYFGAIARSLSFRWVESPVAATAKTGAAYAVYATSLTNVEDVSVQRQSVRAVTNSGSNAYAVVLGAVTRVSALKVQHVVTEVKCAQGSNAYTLVVVGATNEVGALLYKNVTGTALAGTNAQAVGFNGAVSKLGSLVIEDVDLDTRTVSTGSNQGYGARSIVFFTTVEVIGTFVVRNAKLRADAIKSYMYAYSFFGARSLWFREAVRHVTTLLIEDVNATATCGEKYVSAVHFNDAVTNVSSLQVSRVMATATSTGGSVAYAVMLSALEAVGELVVTDTTAVSTAAASSAYALYVASMATGQRLHVVRSTLRATGTASTYAMYTGALTSVASFVVADCTIETRASSGADSYAAYTSAVTNAAEVLYVRSNVTAHAQSSGVRAVAGTTLTHVGRLVVQNMTISATAMTSSSAYAASWTSTLQYVRELSFLNVTASAKCMASSTAHAVSLPGALLHSGPVVLCDVTATADAKGGTASVMQLGAWNNVTSLLVQGSTLETTGGADYVRALSFESSIVGTAFLNVTDSTLVADSSAATGSASNAYALHVAGKMTDVGAVDVLRSTVRAVAKTSTSRAVAVMGPLLRVGRVVLQQSTVEARSETGSSAYAAFIVTTSEMAAFEIVDTPVTAYAGTSGCHAVHGGALTNVERVAVVRSPATATAGTSGAYAVYVASMTGGQSLVVRDAPVTATAASTAYAMYTGALVNVRQVQFVNAHMTATAGAGSPRALHIASVTDADAVLVEHVQAVATTTTGGSAYAVVFGAISSVVALTVQHVFTNAVCDKASSAYAVVVTGAMVEVGALLYKNVTGTALAGTNAQAVGFNGAVSKLGSLVIEDVDLDTRTVSTGSNQGYAARAITFYTTVEVVGTFVVRNAKLRADAIKSYTYEYSSFGARSLWFREAVRHLTTLVIEDVNATATCGEKYASAVHFNGAVTNVSSLQVSRVMATATSTGSSTVSAVTFSRALTTVGELVVADTTAVATAATSSVFSLFVASMATGQRLHVVRSTARASGTASAHAMYTGALTSVASFVVADCTIETRASSGDDSYAAYTSAVTDAAEVLYVRSNVTAHTQTSAAYAVAGSTLTHVGRLVVENMTVSATALTSSSAYAASWTSTLQYVRELSFLNVTASAKCMASSTAHAVSLPGALSHSGPVVLRDVTATAYAKGDRAAIMQLGAWNNVTSLLVQGSTLETTGGANYVRTLSFESSIVGTAFLNVTDSTLVADSSAATGSASNAYALHVAGKMTDVGAVDVLRSTVRAVAKTSTSRAVAVMGPLLRVGRVVLQQSTVEARSETGSSAYAAFIVTTSEMAAFEIVDTPVTAYAGTSGCHAVHGGALTNVERVAVVRSPATATAGTSGAYAVYVASMTGGQSLVVRDAPVTATAASTAYAMYTGALVNVRQVQFVNAHMTATAGAGSPRALHIASVTDADAVLVEHVQAVATTTTGGSAYAVVFGAISSVVALTVQHVFTNAVCDKASSAYAVVVTGAMVEVGALLYKNVTGTALAGTNAQAVGFNGVVSKLGSLVIEDVDLDTRTVSTGSNQGYAARAITFYTTVEVVGTFVVRNAKLRADAIKSYAYSSSVHGARSLWFREAVRHVTTLLIEDVNATATCGEKFASAVHLNGAVTNVSSLQVSRVTATATSTGSSTVSAVTFSRALTTVGELVVADTTAVATAATSSAYALYVASMATGQRLHVVRSTLRATGTASTYAMYTGALTSVASFVVADCTIETRASSGDDSYAAYTSAVTNAAEVLYVRSNVTAHTQTSAAYAVAGTTLTHVGRLVVENMTVSATALTSSSAYAASWTSTLQYVRELSFLNVTASAKCMASSTAHAVSLPGALSHSGPVVLRDVTATAYAKGDRAAIMQLGAWNNVTSLLVQGSTLETTGGANYVRTLSFESSIVGTAFLNVTDSTLVADSSAATGSASNAYALHVAGKLTDVGAVDVLRSTVRAVAKTSTSRAVALVSTLLRVGCVVLQQSTVEARSEAGSSAYAVFFSSTSEMATFEVVDTTVTAYAKTSPVFAIYCGALRNVERVAVVRSPATATAGTSGAYAVYVASMTGGQSLVVRDAPVTATAASTAYAMYTGALVNVRQVQFVNAHMTATAGAGSPRALHIASVTDADAVLVEHVQAVATTTTGGSAYAVVFGAISSVVALTVQHVFTNAVCDKASSAYAVVVTGAMVEVGALLYKNVTGTALAGTNAQAVGFNGAVSKLGSLVIEDVDLDTRTVSTGSNQGYAARAITFYTTVEVVGTFVVRNAKLRADAIKSYTYEYSSFGARSLWFREAVRHLTTLVIEDVNATATCGGALASAVHFKGAVTNVSRTIARNILVRVTASSDVTALVIPNSVESEFQRIDMFLSATAGTVTSMSFTGNPTRLILKEVSLRVIASQASVAVFSSALIRTTLLIEDCVFNVSSPSLVLPTLPAVTDSDIRIEGTKFDFSAASTGSVDTFLLIRSLVRSFLSVRRCDFYAADAHPAQFVQVTGSVVNSTQHYSGTTAAAAFGTSPAPFNLPTPSGLCELCFNQVTFLPSATRSYDPSRLEALGYVMIDPSRCRATDTAELTKTASVLSSASATFSALRTVSETAPVSLSVSRPPSVSGTSARTASATGAFTASVTASSTATLQSSPSRSGPTATVASSSSLSMTGATESHSSAPSISRSSTLSVAATLSAVTPSSSRTLSPSSVASTTVTSTAPETSTAAVTFTATVPETSTAAATGTANPTATERLAVVPRAVSQVLEGARTVAKVTSSVSAIVSPTSALAQQRAGALTSKTCPEDPPNGEDPLSFLDNPMQQSMGNGPAKYHVGAVAGNLLILAGGTLLCALSAVSVAFVSHVFPKHHEREAARLAGRGAYVLCVFLQCFGGEVIMIVALLIVTPSCAAAVVCVGHPSSDVTAFERALGAITLVIVLFTATALSVLTARARRYCYCPEEDRSRQAAEAVAADRVKGAPPAPWESTSTVSDVASSCADPPVTIVDDDDDDSQVNVQSTGSGDALLLPASTTKNEQMETNTHAEGTSQRKSNDRMLAAARRIAQVVVLGPEWEARPELRPLLAGAAEAILLLIGDSRPAITRPELCFLDRHGCHWFFALDLWVAVLTGVGVGVLELSHCGVAPAVAVLQFLYVFLFIITRPLRSPLLLGVSFIALVLQSAAVILAAVTSSGLFSKPRENTGSANGGGEDEDGTADLLDLVSTMLALVLAVQGIIALGVGAATRFHRKQRADERAAEVHRHDTQDVMMGDVTNGDTASVPLLERLLLPDQSAPDMAPGSPMSTSVSIPMPAALDTQSCGGAVPPAASSAFGETQADDLLRELSDLFTSGVGVDNKTDDIPEDVGEPAAETRLTYAGLIDPLLTEVVFPEDEAIPAAFDPLDLSFRLDLNDRPREDKSPQPDDQLSQSSHTPDIASTVEDPCALDKAPAKKMYDVLAMLGLDSDAPTSAESDRNVGQVEVLLQCAADAGFGDDLSSWLDSIDATRGSGGVKTDWSAVFGTTHRGSDPSEDQHDVSRTLQELLRQHGRSGSSQRSTIQTQPAPRAQTCTTVKRKEQKEKSTLDDLLGTSSDSDVDGRRNRPQASGRHSARFDLSPASAPTANQRKTDVFLQRSGRIGSEAKSAPAPDATFVNPLAARGLRRAPANAENVHDSKKTTADEAAGKERRAARRARRQRAMSTAQVPLENWKHAAVHDGDDLI